MCDDRTTSHAPRYTLASWISVTDELPVDSNTVIPYRSANQLMRIVSPRGKSSIHEGYLYSADASGGPWEWYFQGPDSCRVEGVWGTVTHWSPMPEFIEPDAREKEFGEAARLQADEILDDVDRDIESGGGTPLLG